MELYCFGVEKAHERKQQREKSADSEQFLFVLSALFSFFASSVLCLLCYFPPHVKNPREVR